MRDDLNALLERAANGGHPQGLPANFQSMLHVPSDSRRYAEAQRATAVWVLARLGRAQAVPVFVKCLRSRSGPLRAAAARGLGELGMIETGVVASLVKTLRRDSDSQVREAVWLQELRKKAHIEVRL